MLGSETVGAEVVVDCVVVVVVAVVVVVDDEVVVVEEARTVVVVVTGGESEVVDRGAPSGDGATVTDVSVAANTSGTASPSPPPRATTKTADSAAMPARVHARVLDLTAPIMPRPTLAHQKPAPSPPNHLDSQQLESGPKPLSRPEETRYA